MTLYRDSGDDGGLRLVSYGVVDHLESSEAEATHEESHAPTDPGPGDDPDA